MDHSNEVNGSCGQARASGGGQGGALAPPLEFAKYRNLEGYFFVTSFFYKLAV